MEIAWMHGKIGTYMQTIQLKVLQLNFWLMGDTDIILCTKKMCVGSFYNVRITLLDSQASCYS